MVSGTGNASDNKLVPGPPPATLGSRPLLSTRVHAIELPLAEDRETGWKPYPVFRGATRDLADFGCHVSVLSPGTTPHPPHRHAEEELLVMLDGEAELRIVERGEQVERRHRLRPGSFVYYPADQLHTLHCPGPESATYLMFKWQSERSAEESTLETTIVPFLELSHPDPDETTAKPFVTRRVLEGDTRHLARLHAHVSTLLPGAGYEPHVDAYDVAILVLRGIVETLDQQAGPNSVIFYAAGEPHGMRNVGDEPATYLVFEFHANNALALAERRSRRQRWLRRLKTIGNLPRDAGRLLKRCLRRLRPAVPARRIEPRPHPATPAKKRAA